MAVTVLGNHPASLRGNNSTGYGTQSKQSLISWTGLVGHEAGDQMILPLSSIGALTIDQGVTVQASVEVTIALTLSPQELVVSKNPKDWEAITWSPEITLPARELKDLGLIFTAMRVTFPTPGEFFVGVH